jgi:hypothetical protein
MDLSELPSDEIREMLRDSLRGFLGENWNTGTAAKQAAAPEEISQIWTGLVGQGVAALGCDFGEGGLREILVVMAELGRAACPAPMWSAALANLGLSGCSGDIAADLLEKLHVGAAIPGRFASRTERRADCSVSSKSRQAVRTFSSRWIEGRWR